MQLHVDNLAGTHAVAAAIAAFARAGDVVVLAGEMGTGKTAFAQGFGRALGVTDAITSPTFTLVRSYPCRGKLTLHHADLYRLDSSTDVDDLALPELAAFDGVVLVEWGDVAAGALGDHLEVRLAHGSFPSLDDDSADDDSADDDFAADDDSTDDDSTDDDSTDDDFADDGVREIELHATGGVWAGRWDRLTRALEAYRC